MVVESYIVVDKIQYGQNWKTLFQLRHFEIQTSLLPSGKWYSRKSLDLLYHNIDFFNFFTRASEVKIWVILYFSIFLLSFKKLQLVLLDILIASEPPDP